MGYPVVVTEPTGEGMETIVESISNIDTDGIITALEGIKDSLDAMAGPNIAAIIADGSAININASDLDGATRIKTCLFKSVSTLETIELPDTVTQIDSEAFSGCSNLESISIPSTVQTLSGGDIFKGCNKLKSVVIPSGVTTIGIGCFNYCTSIEEIYFPSTITSIAYNACTGINANAVINCGFASGAVSNAPWGAPNTVTINYNVPQP